jgi:hypothetical protein
MTAVWASHHEELCSDGVVAPHVCAHMGVPHRWVVLDGSTLRGQPWTPALMLPHGCDGLSVRRMTVLCTFRMPSMGRPVPRQFMRNELLDLATILLATACHQRNDVETYSRWNF